MYMINCRFHWTWWETSNYEESTKRNWHFEKTRSVTTWIHWFQLIFTRQYVRVTPLSSCSSCLVGYSQVLTCHRAQTSQERWRWHCFKKQGSTSTLFSVRCVNTRMFHNASMIQISLLKKYITESNFSKVIFSSGLCLNFQLHHV